MCSTGLVGVDEAVAAVAAVDPGGDRIVALHRLVDAARAALLGEVARFDAERGWQADGALSFPTWLTSRVDVRRGEAARLHRLARKVVSLPVVAERVESGA